MFSSRTATTGAIRRLQVEYKQLTSDPHSLFPATGPISEDDFLTWEALLPGPEDTPFEGGVFRAELKFRECRAAGCGECAAVQAGRCLREQRTARAPGRCATLPLVAAVSATI